MGEKRMTAKQWCSTTDIILHNVICTLLWKAKTGTYIDERVILKNKRGQHYLTILYDDWIYSFFKKHHPSHFCFLFPNIIHSIIYRCIRVVPCQKKKIYLHTVDLGKNSTHIGLFLHCFWLEVSLLEVMARSTYLIFTEW